MRERDQTNHSPSLRPPHPSWCRRIAFYLYFSITFIAFLTTVASVVYGNLNSIDWLSDDTRDFLKEYLTYAIVMLPIIAGFLTAILSKGAYESKWKWCMMGATQIVSEIYKFRTKTHPYRDITDEEIKAEKEVGVSTHGCRRRRRIPVHNIPQHTHVSFVLSLAVGQQCVGRTR